MTLEQWHCLMVKKKVSPIAGILSPCISEKFKELDILVYVETVMLQRREKVTCLQKLKKNKIEILTLVIS